MRHLYSVLFVLLLPAIVVRLWWRGRNLPAYRQRWAERFAFFETPHFGKPVIWVHTVSVGEFIAAQPMIDRLLQLESHQIVVTTMTPTGSERVRKSYGERVFHVYAPYDIPALVHRFLAKIQPALAIFLETELWPNIVFACHQKNITTLLANGRLSEKSARGYRRVAALTRPMLQQLSSAAIQNQADAERFSNLGLASEKISVTGSIKFDIQITASLHTQAEALQEKFSNAGQHKIWIAASTHKGEDEIILDAFKALRSHLPNHKLILVPRHPDRFESVYQLCCDRGYRTLRRSLTGDTLPNADFDILLGDTMGELMLLFGCANAAFVGGSFVPNGGHNTIEPAVWGIPVLSGPSQFNFAEISRLLNDAGALITVNNARALSDQLHTLLTTSAAHQYGAAAREVAKQNQGALQRLMQIIMRHL